MSGRRPDGFEQTGGDVTQPLSPFGYWKSAMTTGYADFRGRARRREFWWTLLFNAAALGASADVLSRTEALADVRAAGMLIIGLLLAIPQLAVSVRRLHDIDKGGGWVFLYFLPFGACVLFYYSLSDTSPHANDWGDPAK